MPVKARSAKDRFLSKIKIEGECWVWIGGSSFGMPGRPLRSVNPRRASYLIFVGDTSKPIFGKCNNTMCVRPEHLFEGSMSYCKRSDLSIEERFFTFVNKTSTCWLWTGAKAGNGYGTFRYGFEKDRTQVYAHRFSYQNFVGDIPKGYGVLHHCDLPACALRLIT